MSLPVRTRMATVVVLALLVLTVFAPGAWASAPKITSFSPGSGIVGSKVTINGANFTSVKSVKFGTATAAFSVGSAKKITATVPAAATTGKISVTTSGGVAKSAGTFTVLPSIASFAPSSGIIGSTVTINGGGFTGATVVTFNLTPASFTVENSGRITATVPAGATTGAIAVTTAGGTATTGASFTVLPHITSFSPTSGAVGSSVVITGTGFTGVTGVTFNGVTAGFTPDSATQVTATVPTTFSGPIAVTTAAGTATSASNFSVLPSVVLSSVAGPPSTKITVSGLGFAASETVDVYLDASQVGLAGTATDGTFSGVAVTIPASAGPGAHTVSVVGRRDGAYAQTTFTVRTDWAMFRNTPSHRGNNTYENTVGTGNVGDLFQSWSVNVNGAPSSPAIVGGVIYVGSGNGTLYAFNESDGAQLWSFPTTGAITASPAVVNGVVYAVSADGKLWAIDATAGTAVWGAPVTLLGTSNSSPTVIGGVVYLGTTTNAYAIDATSGAVDWTIAPGAGSFTGTSPAVANGSVVFTSSTGHAVAYSSGAAGGALQWNVAPGGNLTTPLIVSGSVYMGSSNGNIFALSLATGGTQWSDNPSGVAFVSAPAYANGLIDIGSNDGNVYAYDTTGGNPWANGNGTSYRSPVTVANGVVYAGSNDDGIYAFDASSGQILWSGSTNGTVTASPVIVDGTLFVGSNDGHLYAYGLAGGA